MLFENERKIQQWLSESFAQGHAIKDLITNLDDFDLVNFPPDLSHAALKVYETFHYCLQSFEVNEVIMENTNISLGPRDSLRPDFLIYAPETETVIILEIKNIAGPSREAGTELSAYSAEVKNYIPFLSDGDVVNVIISTQWPTLLRHYIFNEIFWLQRNLICLQPVETATGTALAVLDPKVVITDDLRPAIGLQHLGGYQLCLYDDELYRGGDFDRHDDYKEQMMTALNAMSVKGYAQRSHGFAFLWKNNFKSGLAPYNITLINIAPFRTLERLFHDEKFEPNPMTLRMVDMVKEYAPDGHGMTLESIKNYGERFLAHFCTPRTEGFSTWEYLRSYVFKETDVIAFVGWGFFGELYFDRLHKAYLEGDQHISSTDPFVGIALLDELIDENYPFIDLSYYRADNEDEPDFFDQFDLE
jgi:hypothetical protein